MLIRKIIFIITLSFMATAANAQMQTLGPDVGTKIPHDLALMATTGKMENFDSLKGEKGMAIFYVRSFDWCPYCQKQAIEVNERADDFISRGINPVLVSYDTADIQKNFSDKWKFKAKLISDVDRASIEAFGILNEDASTTSPLYGYPHPIVFIVDKNGVIKSKLYIENENKTGSSYSERPPINDILANIDGLNLM